MPRPDRWFVRVWTVDPDGEGPDEEDDFKVDSERVARALAKKWRRNGKSAGAFERRNIHVPDFIPIDDPPAYLWEYDAVQIDEDEIEREYQRAARK